MRIPKTEANNLTTYSEMLMFHADFGIPKARGGFDFDAGWNSSFSVFEYILNQKMEEDKVLISLFGIYIFV